MIRCSVLEGKKVIGAPCGVTGQPGLIVSLGLAVLLAGCAASGLRQAAGVADPIERHARVPPALERALAMAPECCANDEPIPGVGPAGVGRVEVTIGPGSPVLRLPGGRSFVAAWRIDHLPRPFLVEVSSLRAVDPTSAEPAPARVPDLVMAPVALVLDAEGRVRRSEGPGPALPECEGDPASPAWRIDLVVVEPPPEATTLVVGTADELRARYGERVCGAIRQGHSPAGRVGLHIRSLEHAAQGRAPRVYPARLLERRSGLERLVLPLRAADADGWLLLSEDALHVVQAERGRLRTALALARDRLVSVRELEPEDGGAPGVRLLALPEGPAGDGERMRDGLAWWRIHVPGASAEVATRLGALALRDRWIEPLHVRIDRREPEIDFRREGQTPLVRIGESALAAGSTTALPCALCQTGACSPDTLASCAALFSIGAVLGGAIGAGQELAQRLSPEGQQTIESLTRLELALKPSLQRAQGERFREVAFGQCVAGGLAAVVPERWRSQGRSARPSVVQSQVDGRDPAHSPEARRLPGSTGVGARPAIAATASVARVSLIALSGSAEGLSVLRASTPVRMEVVVELAVERDGEPLPTARLAWRGEARPEGRWEREGTRLAASDLQEACAVLGRAVAENVQRAWRAR